MMILPTDPKYGKEKKNEAATKFNISVHTILHNKPMVRIKCAATNFRKENCRNKESFMSMPQNFNIVLTISMTEKYYL